MGKMKGRFSQLHLAFAVSFGQLILSLLSVWPSYTNSLLESKDTPLSAPMTTSEEALLGSLPSLGSILGTAVTGIIIDKLGRKNGGIVLSLPNVISWAMIGATKSIKVVLVARFLSGIAGGSSLVYAPIFISEISEDDFRGTLASGVTLTYCLGILLSYLFGWFLSYHVIIYINLTLSVVCTLLLVSVRESPVYFLKEKRYEDARDAVAHYRGCSPLSSYAQKEFTKLKMQIMPAEQLLSISTEKEAKLNEAGKLNISTDRDEPLQAKKVSKLKLLFFTKSSRRAFWVVLTISSTQVLMGMAAVQVYAESLFQQREPEHASLYTVIFALVLTVGSFVPSVLADRFGRRVLLISSCILVCICLVTLGVLFQLRAGPSWLTVLFLMLYCFCLMYGASSVPYILLTESFVSEIQNLASILIVEWVWFLNFFVIAVFPYMNGAFGVHGTLYCFAAVSIANAVIIYFIVPETKGLSIDQIQLAFLGKLK